MICFFPTNYLLPLLLPKVDQEFTDHFSEALGAAGAGLGAQQLSVGAAADVGRDGGAAGGAADDFGQQPLAPQHHEPIGDLAGKTWEI